MKILYDQQIFSFQDFGGISRYIYEIAKRIKATNNEILVDGKYSNNIYIKNLRKNVFRILPDFKFPYKNIIIFYLNVFFGKNVLDDGGFDLLHATYYHPYFINKLKGAPFVITVHDMIHELFEKSSGLRDKTINYKKASLLRANHIIAVSANTKKDLVNLYNIPENKITVIHHGNPFESITPKKIENLPSKYILYVGNRSGYKNFTFFVKSITPILLSKKNIFLICSGGANFSKEENNLLSKLLIRNKVIHIKFTNDNQFAYIYKRALLYVLPSLYEGFGLTILEAFAMGCPVVASNTSSIPEVGGKAVCYINPNNQNSIRKAIENIIDDETLRNNFVRNGYIQLKRFNWNRTVKQTLDVYKMVSKNMKLNP